MRAVVAILCVLTLPVLMESCFLWHEDGGTQPTFSILNFTLKTEQISTKKPPTSSIRASDVRFGLDVVRIITLYRGSQTMGAYADQLPPASVESITSFKITSDSAVETLGGQTFEAGSDLNSIFNSDEFYDNKVLYWTYWSSLSVPISKAQTHNFKFSITLSDGRYFDLQSGSFELLPD